MNELATSPKSLPVTRTGLRINWQHLLMWVVILVLFMLFLGAVKPILMPFVLGMTVAYLMDPVAGRLVRLGMSRHVAAAVLTVGLFALLITAVVWLGPLLYHQLAELFVKLPALLKQLTQAVQQDAAPLLRTLQALAGPHAGESIPSSVSEILQNGVSSIGSAITRLLSSAATVINLAASLLITPIVCFYLICDWPGVLKRADQLLPLAYAPTIREQLHLINKTLASYLRGQLTVIGLLMVGYSIAFALIGVNYSLLLAFLAGALVIIPYIGTLISVAMGLVIAYGQFGMDTSWWAMVAVYGIGQLVESQYLTPKIIGDRVGLHPLWMLFGMLSGAVLFGLVGVLLAVPLTAVISVLVKFAIGQYLQSGLYSGD